MFRNLTTPGWRFVVFPLARTFSMSIASEMLSEGLDAGLAVSGELLTFAGGTSVMALGDMQSLLTADDALAHDPRESMEFHIKRPLPAVLVGTGQVQATLLGVAIVITEVIDNPAAHYVILKAVKR